MKNTEIKDKIVSLLKLTERKGIDNLIEHMEEAGFFNCPCSGSNHLAVEGGLAEHSYNVYRIMKDSYILIPDVLNAIGMNSKEIDNSVIICSLLHDLGKMGDFGKPGYVPNMVKDGRPTKAEPEQKYKQSESKPFEVNKDLSPVNHEVRSVKIASKYIELTEEEELAILWHNGLYGNFKYDINGKETPLYLLLHFADMWASRVMEV